MTEESAEDVVSRDARERKFANNLLWLDGSSW